MKDGNNYRITEDDHIGKGGNAEKFENNLAAIVLLKQIESEGRKATPEEQAILVRYTGWGWAGQLFHPDNDSTWKPGNNWKKQHDALRPLLTDAEWMAAYNSTTNAHYTAPGVISAMWEAVRHLGFTRGKVLEPSAGIGHYIGLMPADMFASSPTTCVELDSLSGRITRQLYQATDTYAQGFETAPLTDNFYDLAISNVPFGNFGIADKIFNNPRLKFLSKSIHNYFFAKALMKVRPGGIVAFVTSSHTMDAPTSNRVREYLGRNADFLGAMRMPNDAFKENAGTEVTTDIIFLRRRVPGEDKTGESFTDVAEIDTPDGKVKVNEYYARHPEMMLGQMGLKGSQYRGNEQALTSDGRDLPAAIAEAIKALPAGVYSHSTTTVGTKKQDGQLVSNFGHRIGCYAVKDGELFMCEPGDDIHVGNDENGNGIYAKGPNVLLPVAHRSAARIKDMCELRDVVRRLVDVMTDADSSEERYLDARLQMGASYDSFVKKNGVIYSSANLSAFSADADLPLLMSLEKYDEKTKTATKADVFTKRTVTPRRPADSANNAQDAMLYALNEDEGLNWDRMATLTGRSPESIQAELALAGHVYHNPTGAWETADGYLSGNVREKLVAAQAAAAQEPRYQQNVDALLAVQPPDLTATDIAARLGASWIPPDIIKDFIHHIVGMPAYIADTSAARVRYLEASGAWVVDGVNHNQAYGARHLREFGHANFSGTSLIELALNQQRPEVTMSVDDGKGGAKRVIDREATDAACEAQNKVKAEFQDWLWKDDDRTKQMTAIYNRDMNNEVPRVFSGQHLTLPGLSDAARANMLPHIKDAVWRVLQDKNTLLDHCVGAGKSWEVGCSALELRRRGMARKPMITVPNHLVTQTAVEMRTLYPDANILIATKKDFERENRKRFLAKVAFGDWDAVVIAHSTFGKIGMSDETTNKFHQDQLDEINEVLAGVVSEDPEGEKSKTAKELIKQRNRLVSKLDKRIAAQAENHDDFLTFENLGVDRLFVDEAHLFKNLQLTTRQTRVKGIPASGSARAFDMLMKVRHIQSINNGGGVCFASGTPITNTICEAYTLQRYLDPDYLDKRNMRSFDSWAANFGETASGFEYTAAGEYKPVTRFSKFVNVPELGKAMRRFTDTKTRHELNLPVPEYDRETIACPASQEQNDYVLALADRAKAIQKGDVDPTVDNMLKITGDARKNSLDPRLVDGAAPEHSGGKVPTCATNVADIYHKTAADRLTQVVFLDLGTPKASDKPDTATGDDEGETDDPVVLMNRAVKRFKDKHVRKYAQDWADWNNNGREGDEPSIYRDEIDQPGGWKEEARVAIPNMLMESTTPEAQKETADEARHRESVYQDLKNKMIANGVKENEIAFIHDAKTDAEKQVLFQKVRSGEIRVLVGSTEKMGTGMNAQHKMIALHHMDCPWRPDMLEQREGRIIRQGNAAHLAASNPFGGKVKVINYVTQGINGAPSMDTVLWGIVKRKAESLLDLKRGDPALRNMDDVSDTAASAGMTIAVASGNPLVEEQQALLHNMDTLAMREKNHNRKQERAKQDIESLPGKIKTKEDNLKTFEGQYDFWQKSKGKPGDPFAATVAGETFDKSEHAGIALITEAQAAAKFSDPNVVKPIGEFSGVTLSVGKDPMNPAGLVYLSVPGHSGYVGSVSAEGAEDGKGFIQRLRNIMEGLGRRVAETRNDIDTMKGDHATLQTTLEASPYSEDIAKINTRLREINKALGTDKEDEQAGAAEESEISKAIAACLAVFGREPLAKALVYKPGKEGGAAQWGGASSNLTDKTPSFGPQNPGSGVHAASLRPLSQAASLVPGLQHGATRFAGTHYQHSFSARNPELAAHQLMQTLGSHAVTSVTPHPDGSRGVTAHMGGVSHTIAIARPPKVAPLSGLTAAAKTGAAAVGRAARHTLVTVTHGAGKVRAWSAARNIQPAEDTAETQPFHDAATNLGAGHHTTTVQKASKNFAGQKVDKKYNHFYTHKNPQVSARRMAASLEGQGHGVSSVTQSRVYTANGGIRHQYSFNVSHKDGGPSHTVNFFRGEKQATPASSSASGAAIGATGGRGAFDFAAKPAKSEPQQPAAKTAPLGREEQANLVHNLGSIHADHIASSRGVTGHGGGKESKEINRYTFQHDDPYEAAQNIYQQARRAGFTGTGPRQRADYMHMNLTHPDGGVSHSIRVKALSDHP